MWWWLWIEPLTIGTKHCLSAIKLGAHSSPPSRPDLSGGRWRDPGLCRDDAAIEAVTQKKVEVIVGKPFPHHDSGCLDVMGLRPEECILMETVWRRILRWVRESGNCYGIVLTGVTDETTLKEYKHSPMQPDLSFQSIADVENLLIMWWRDSVTRR